MPTHLEKEFELKPGSKDFFSSLSKSVKKRNFAAARDFQTNREADKKQLPK
jgi:hypothetical protein